MCWLHLIEPPVTGCPSGAGRCPASPLAYGVFSPPRALKVVSDGEQVQLTTPPLELLTAVSLSGCPSPHQHASLRGTFSNGQGGLIR